jgi:acetamidase/formamidase
MAASPPGISEVDRMPATHVIPLGRETLHGHFSIDLPPVLTVDPGDSVTFQALNAGWHWDAGGRWLDDLHPLLDDGHPLTGPIAVRGARAGGTLEVRIDLVRPRGWGVTFAGESALEWQLGGTTGVTADGAQSVALAPFLGVIGMPPPELGVRSTTPPRRFGGNIDCKELTAGATLLLPIGVDGALLSAGDGHAAQGDGEVSGTAIECPLDEARLTLGLRPDLELRMPIARTDSAWITFGFDHDLDVAADVALETMVDLMQREHGLGRDRALALASVCVDLRVTQVVNEAKGVHAVLRHDALSA